MLLGLIDFTFSGLNWHVWFTAWIAPVLLLYFARNAKWAAYLILFLGIALGSAISKSAENLSGIFLIYITTGVSYGLLHTLPFVLDKLLVKKGMGFYSTLVFPSAVVFTEFGDIILIDSDRTKNCETADIIEVDNKTYIRNRRPEINLSIFKV